MNKLTLNIISLLDFSGKNTVQQYIAIRNSDVFFIKILILLKF